jgi:hypothetical protein
LSKILAALSVITVADMTTVAKEFFFAGARFVFNVLPVLWRQK